MTSAPENATVHLENAFADLLDLGSRIAGLRFHAIGEQQSVAFNEETPTFLNEVIAFCKKTTIEGLVLFAENGSFPTCAPLLSKLAQSSSENAVDDFIQNVQQTMMSLKYAPFPVVTAVDDEALGLGCTLALVCDKVCMSQNGRLGYTELQRGTIPIGGGTIQLMINFAATATVGGPFAYARQAFDTLFDIGVAEGAKAASDAGYLTRSDSIAGPHDNLLALAVRESLQMFHNGYHPPPNHRLDLPGAGGALAIALDLDNRRALGEIDDNRLAAGKHLATLLCGEKRNVVDGLSEEELLKLERKLFFETLQWEETRRKLNSDAKQS